MRKIVLNSKECGNLIPHWPELDYSKISKLKRMLLRKSNFDKARDVMCSVGIIITEDGYIVNGKHRASVAFIRGFNHEAYVVRDSRDIIFHIPHKAYGSEGIENLLEAFDYRHKYMGICFNQGVMNIRDLVRVNKDLFN